MDLETLKTFVEVSQTRHFARAANNLFVTQAAVSARIAQLEEKLGTRVFTRARNNIQLTTAGHRLLPHAETILGAWNRALLETAGPDDATLVTIGCMPSIAEMHLDQIIAYYRTDLETMIHVEQLNSQTIISRVREQTVNIGLLYEPPRAKDLSSSHVADLNLVLVSTGPNASVADLENYIYVDWGTSFAISHELDMPESLTQDMRVDTPGPALRSLLASGGAAYLPRALVDTHLESATLFLVPDAPELTRSIFLTTSMQSADQQAVVHVAAELSELVGGS